MSSALQPYKCSSSTNLDSNILQPQLTKITNSDGDKLHTYISIFNNNLDLTTSSFTPSSCPPHTNNLAYPQKPTPQPSTNSHIPRQLLRMRPWTRPRARQPHASLVLYIRAQHLCAPPILGLDVDPREMEPVTWRGRAAVDPRGDIVPACAGDVFPADVGDGEAGGVAVLVRVCVSR